MNKVHKTEHCLATDHDVQHRSQKNNLDSVDLCSGGKSSSNIDCPSTAERNMANRYSAEFVSTIADSGAIRCDETFCGLTPAPRRVVEKFKPAPRHEVAK